MRRHFVLPHASPLIASLQPATAQRSSSSMEKPGGKRWLPRLLLLIAMTWLLMVYFHVAVFHAPPVTSAPLVAVASGSEDGQRFLLRQEEQLKKIASAGGATALPAAGDDGPRRRPAHGAGEDKCRGRYVYIHDLPPRFNADIIRNCRKTEDHWGDMCRFLTNAGLGGPLADRVDDGGALRGEAGWYDTHQFALDAIFHNRMRQYECLTADPAAASAVFVPFYAGFDFVRYHWGYDNATRDAASLDLAAWLMARPEWRHMGGRDHFLVAGRTGWDFRRSSNVDPDWGNDLLVMPAGRNMSVLVLESAMLHGSDYPVPYPTYFHPRSDADVLRWQDRVRGRRRTWLMAFVGAPRPDVPINIRVRDHVIAQCKAASAGACTMLGCARNTGSTQCHTPGNIMRLFQKTVFCLQPPGDTCTRRSAFDSMVAGCIPVFFHPGSAYKQYRWHLPGDHHRYSVYIPDADVRQRNVSIEDVLRAIPPATVERMREEVIRLIPRVLYADPRSKLETVKDAVDIAVEGVLDTVARVRNGEYVDSGGPVTEDPPNLFSSTESIYRPKPSLQADR